MMDIFAFYCSVLDEEIQFSNVSAERFKNSLAAISSAYSPESLKNGQTYLDYNIPSHRCAYLYKFAPCHTELLYIYFRIFLRESPQALSTLIQKETLKICCLGGGAGTDVVGILRALVSYSCLRRKVNGITVLDICGGWRNSFKRIIQKLKEGDQGNMSGAFLDRESLAAKLIGVDLTDTLPDAVLQVIREADIICMVKFVSAVISKPSAELAFKNLASHMKSGAIVIFIDNLSNQVYEPINDIFCQAGLHCVFGPHHARFKMKGSYPSKFKYSPTRSRSKSIAVSVLGWIKAASSSVPDVDEEILLSVPQNVLSVNGTNDEDEEWETFGDATESNYGHCQPIDGNEDYSSSDESPSSVDEVNFSVDKFTQTMEHPNASSFHVSEPPFSGLEHQLSLLTSRLNDLESLVKNVIARDKVKCCSTLTPCCSDTSHCSSVDEQHHCFDHKCCSGRGASDTRAFCSGPPKNQHCCHRKAAGVQNTPFLVLPTENLLNSERSALLSILLSSYSTNQMQ